MELGTMLCNIIINPKKMDEGAEGPQEAKIILYSIAKKSGSHREIQKIKKTRKEDLKDKYSSSEDWDSYS